MEGEYGQNIAEIGMETMPRTSVQLKIKKDGTYEPITESELRTEEEKQDIAVEIKKETKPKQKIQKKVEPKKEKKKEPAKQVKNTNVEESKEYKALLVRYKMALTELIQEKENKISINSFTTEITKLKKEKKQLTDGVVQYRKKMLVNKLKNGFAINLLIETIACICTEEELGKITKKYYNELNSEQNKDMLSI